MPVSGYASTTYAAPGTTVDLYLSASAIGTVEIEITELGPDVVPSGGRFSLTLDRVQGMPGRDGWLGYAWAISKSFVVPTAWRTGLYRLRAKGPGDGGVNDVLDLAIKSANPGSASRTLLLVDFIRPQAYNGSGGKSLYDAPGNPKADRVSFNRPATEMQTGDEALIRWLRGHGFGFECTSLVELHSNPWLLSKYACILFGPHAEYWSKEMRDQVESFVRRGGSVVSLSGNTCYRQVRFEYGTRTLVCYKYARNDPAADLATTTVAFAQPPVHRPPNAMLGVGWTHGAWGGDWTAYRAHFPTHWVFEGTGLSAASPLTPAFMAYETDATEFAWEPEGYPRVTGAEETPLSTVVLASADLGHWGGKPGFATMTLYARHGRVFAAGTTEWIDHLDDPVLSRITSNVLTRLSTPPALGWEKVGHANGATAMCSVENKLFLTTTDNRLWRRHPVLADAPWTPIGHANNVVAMAGAMGLLFAATSGGALVVRPPAEADVPWTPIGVVPGGLRAMGATGGMLYAIDGSGRLLLRPARPSAASWTPVPSMPANQAINAMTSYNGVLLASTSGNRLLRTNFDFVQESLAWLDIRHAIFAKGLAVVDGMLFIATSDHALWWMDLRHAALDALSGRT